MCGEKSVALDGFDPNMAFSNIKDTDLETVAFRILTLDIAVVEEVMIWSRADSHIRMSYCFAWVKYRFMIAEYDRLLISSECKGPP